MQRKIQARLASLPRTQASFIEPMESVGVKTAGGRRRAFGRSYVGPHKIS